ncbi:MAG: ribosome small subunit-dependent GTPase A [Anaerolineae bacterium]|nr:ribosome small subunit-dependent GTPase A [Anaerolineae bacterium]
MILNGLVIKQQSGFFTVKTDDGGVYVCQIRGRIKEEAARRVRKEEEEKTALCALGDRVRIEALPDGTGQITQVYVRQTVLSRATSQIGRLDNVQEREQVIIANADQALFVLAASHPTPNPRTLDRLLVAAERGGIPKICIVVNKIDLITRDEAAAIFDLYVHIGYPVLYASALTGEGIPALRETLHDHISVFTGPSGVGKTSLLNAIQPELGRRVRAVSGATTKGRHTTVHRELIPLDGGGYVADTPGIRSIAIWDVEPWELEAYFIDIAPFVTDCQFADCTHGHEPGCAVRAAVARGEIHPDRFESFLRLREEIENSYEDWV